MAITLERIDSDGLERARALPFYDFVETAAKTGEAYSINDNGYCIVAHSDSLVPNLVVEIKLPRLRFPDDYVELSYKLNDISSGFMWFDTSMNDAFDFAWRMRLPLRAQSPLYISDGHSLPDSIDGLDVVQADDDHLDTAVALLGNIPDYHGGLRAEFVERKIASRNVLSLVRGDQVHGVVALTEQPNNFVTASALAVLPEERGAGLGQRFAQLLLRRIHGEGKRLVAGMANDVPASARIARSLGMTVQRHAFTAQICSGF
ncbi:MAG: GNAT family N-acetyltransferase [Armatimonadota bacterium]